MDWNKATSIERIRMSCEENIEDYNRRLLRHEEGTHMHSFTLGSVAAFELILSHVIDSDDDVIGDGKPFYVCDPKKNKECAKTACIHRKKAVGPFCSYTLNKEYEIDRPPVK